MSSMSCMPNQAAKAEIAMNGTQMKPAFCSQSLLAPRGRDLRLAAEPAEHARGDHQRDDELPDADAEIAEPGIERKRVALLRLGEEEADIRHRGGEIAAAEAAQQRQRQKEDVGGIGALHRKADADRRHHQRPGRIDVHSRPPKIGGMNE